MKRHLRFLGVWVLTFSLAGFTLFPEINASPDPTDSLPQLAQQLKSPEDIAYFLWRNFNFETDQRQFGQEEYWQSPRQFLATRKGDCEDFALFAKTILEAQGKSPLLLNIYGARFAHTVCLLKENNHYTVIDGTHIERYKTANLKEVLTDLYPFWTTSAIVSPAENNSTKGKTLSWIERKVRAHKLLSTSA
jgi:hypothetical protein